MLGIVILSAYIIAQLVNSELLLWILKRLGVNRTFNSEDCLTELLQPGKIATVKLRDRQNGEVIFGTIVKIEEYKESHRHILLGNFFVYNANMELIYVYEKNDAAVYKNVDLDKYEIDYITSTKVKHFFAL